MEDEHEGSGKWALLVGIDRYPKLDSRRQLGGCSNDVQILKDALQRRFGFRDDRIQVLLNEQATREAILGALEALVDRVGEDEIVVFHFSGHGSKRRDGPEKDEPDGFDETLVPYDSGRIDDPNLDITDDEIYDWIQRLTKKTRYLTLIFDCCHSGTAVRGEKIRKLDDDQRSFDKLGAPSVELLNKGDGEKVGPSGWLPQSERYALFAACGSLESANEILVGKNSKTPYGALTYYLVQELLSRDMKIGTYTEVFERLAPRLKARCEYQNPQLEGARDREVFGVKTFEPMSFVSVLARKGDRVTLGAGRVCGLSEGSKWTIHGVGTRSVSDETVPLGTVEIISVGVSTCEARIVDECHLNTISPGTRAFESFRCLEKGTLAIEIVAPSSHPRVAELTQRISKSNLLELAAAGSQPDVHLYLLAPRRQAGPADILPALEYLEVHSWAAASADGHLLGTIVADRNPKTSEILVENLEKSARLRVVSELQNPGSALSELFELKLYRLVEGHCLEPLRDDNDEIFFYEDDALAFAVCNRSPRPAYFYLLDIGLTGRIGLAYPPQGGAKELERGHRLLVGVRPNEELRFSFPDDFETLPEPARFASRETVKLIVTTQCTDFRPLLQSGYRFRTAAIGLGMAQSLEEVLAAKLGNGGYSGALRSPGGEDWTTVERSFRLLPRPASLASS